MCKWGLGQSARRGKEPHFPEVKIRPAFDLAAELVFGELCPGCWATAGRVIRGGAHRDDTNPVMLGDVGLIGLGVYLHITTVSAWGVGNPPRPGVGQ